MFLHVALTVFSSKVNILEILLIYTFADDRISELRAWRLLCITVYNQW